MHKILTLLSPRTLCCNLLWDSSLQLVVVDVADGSRVILSTSPSLSICDVCSSIEPELHTMSLLGKHNPIIDNKDNLILVIALSTNGNNEL